MMPYIIIGIVAAVVLIVAIAVVFITNTLKQIDQSNKGSGPKTTFVFTPEWERVGKRGEEAVTRAIKTILHEDDRLLRNVSIEYDGKSAELDILIVNKYGVFIIEVKNYFGELFGNEDDFEWIKNKVTPAGMTYQQSVKNPIKQVRRQIYILSQLFKSNGIRVWIEGYVFFIEGNSPIESRYILKTQADIDIAIHGGGRNSIDEGTRERIRQLLLGYV